MKHLSLTSRCMIEQYIAYGYSFREIADMLGYQPSTISREVKKYRTFVMPKSPTCAKYGECRNKSHCTMAECTDYQVPHCKKLDKAPFVCNSCPSQDFCSREHAYYHARKADAKSHAVKSESRKSVHLDENEVKVLNELVSPLIKKGQSLSHIYANHSDEIRIARRTMYNYVDKCVLDARNIDLPRKVRYKKRKEKKMETYPYKYREGRTYEDFKSFVEQHPDLCVVEMDTVKGKREQGKCLLTMIFTKYDFMLLFLLESASQQCVDEVFGYLQNALGLNVFRRLFPVILTDNGSEFKNVYAILNLGQIIDFVTANGSYDTTVGRLMLGCNQHKKTKRFVCNLFAKLKESGICICNPDGVVYTEEEFLSGEVVKDTKIRLM